jgi:hypothetical protein
VAVGILVALGVDDADGVWDGDTFLDRLGATITCVFLCRIPVLAAAVERLVGITVTVLPLHDVSEGLGVALGKVVGIYVAKTVGLLGMGVGLECIFVFRTTTAVSKATTKPSVPKIAPNTAKYAETTPSIPDVNAVTNSTIDLRRLMKLSFSELLPTGGAGTGTIVSVNFSIGCLS